MTPIHSIPQDRQDAASVWSEDVTSSGFKLSLREVTNFSGGHRNIRVVSFVNCRGEGEGGGLGSLREAGKMRGRKAGFSIFFLFFILKLLGNEWEAK